MASNEHRTMKLRAVTRSLTEKIKQNTEPYPMKAGEGVGGKTANADRISRKHQEQTRIEHSMIKSK